jgi:hypothetical protein
MDLAELGIKVDSATTVKAVSDLDRLTAASGRAEDATERVGTASVAAGAGAARGGGNIRMFSQQLSQVAQQGAATGQWLQAFTIQAADIGMAFGTVGAIIGTVATIALPALIGALSGGSGGALSFADAMDAANAAMENTDRLAGLVSGDIAAIGDAYGVLTPQIWSLIEAQRQVGFAELSQSADGLVTSLANLYSYSALYGSAGEQLAGALDLGAKSAEHFALTLEYLKGDLTLDQQIAQVSAIRREFEATVGPVGSMTAAQREFYLKLVDAENALVKVHRRTVELSGATATVSRAFESAKKALSDMVAAQPGAGWLSPAISQAEKLAAKLWDAANAAASIKSISASASGMGGGITGAPSASTGPASGSGSIRIPSSGAGAGAGGGATDDFASRLEALTTELQTERETLDAWYAESQKILADRRAMEILGIEGHNKAKLAIEEEYQAKIAEIDARAQQSRLQQVGDFFGVFASIIQTGGQRTVKAYAVISGIQGTISAYAAAIEALRQPGLTLWGRMAAYGTVLAAGLKGVAGIHSAGGIGGASGASGATSTPAAQGGGAASAPSTLTVYGIDPDGIYTGAFFERIFDGIIGTVLPGRNMRIQFQ